MSNPLLTLPPQVGRHYRYRLMETGEVFTCVITEERTHEGEQVWNSKGDQRNWTYWADGEAKIANGTDYVAELIEDIHVLPELEASEDIKEIRKMMEAHRSRSES